jgi:LacI family transcriptional regulator
MRDGPVGGLHVSLDRSIRDVAQAAGVSIGTVSNVLNDLPTVSEDNRSRVLAAIVQIGYVRNAPARLRKSGPSRTLGVILQSADNPYYLEVASGFEQRAAAENYVVFTCNAEGSTDREDSYLTVLEENRVGGVLLVSTGVSRRMAKRLRQVQHRGTPVGVVAPHVEDANFDIANSNDVLGGRLAVEHLLQLGHQRIAYVTGPLNIDAYAQRLEGARGALRNAGLDESTLLVVEHEIGQIDTGVVAGGTLMRMTEPPTAVFCANDLLALGVLQAATTAGKLVPGDLAIIGFDNIAFAAGAAVPLSSVGQQSKRIGAFAAAAMIAKVQDGVTSSKEHSFDPVLVARQSTIGNGVR